MAKEILEPVPVTIENLGNIENSTEGSRIQLSNIQNLLQGQDYKVKIRNIAKDIEEIKTNLKTSLSTISSQTSSGRNNQSNIDSTTLFRSLDEIKSAILSLKNNGGLPSPTSNFPPAPPSSSPTPQDNSNKVQETLSRQQNESTKNSIKNAKDAIAEAINKQGKANAATKLSYENALSALQGGQDEQSSALNALLDLGKGLLGVFNKNFRQIFDTWDRQITTLKETGMGAQNAVALNRMTKQTMNAAEETLGWNISIEKAITTTNNLLKAGQNPKYIRENNRQLIMGLEGLGLNLQPSTIRSITQSVFDSSQVKEIAEGYAKLMSPDTENAISKEELSSFLNSDQYKKLRATMGMYGFSQADIQKELIAQMEESVKGGATGKAAIDMAMTAAQAKLTGGNVIVVPENVQDYIGIAQVGGTFTNVGNLSRDFAEAIRRSKSNPLLNQQFRQIAASTAMNNDFTVLENVIDNDGHTRRQATIEEIERGQYEGLIPRMSKWVAGHLPAESIGGVSQRLTGDSSFLTGQAFNLVGALGKSAFEIKKTALLSQIALNTSSKGDLFKNLLGIGGSAGSGGAVGGVSSGALGKIGGLLGKAGPIALGVAAVGVTAGLIHSAYEEHNQAEDLEKEDKKVADEFYTQELALQESLNKAKLEGNTKLAEDIKKQLDEVREKTNQQLDKITTDVENQSDATVKGWSTGGSALAGAGIGFVAGGPIGAAIGGLIGAVGGYFLSDLAVKSDLGSPDYDREREKRRAEILAAHKFALGGVVSEEQLALVGEGNNPEMIIPLNNSERSKQLLDTVQDVIGESDRVTKEYLTDEIKPILQAQYKDIWKISSILENYFRVINNYPLGHFADGGVVDKEQLAVVGEGNNPEVIIPVTDPEKTGELMSMVSNMSKTHPEVASMMENGVSKIKQSSNNTIADNIIKGAQAQFGKKYAEMVCNQMVESAMKWAGFTPPTTGSVYRHFNHHKMNLILNDPEHGISPTDPNLTPGMLLFSHPFTQEEAVALNKQKGGNRKAGDPGHIGIYAGNGLWWNSTSSKNTVDYSSGKALRITDNKGYGVALTKPFTKGTYKLFAAGFYDGMYDDADIKGLPTASTNVNPPIEPPTLPSSDGGNIPVYPMYASIINDTSGGVDLKTSELTRYRNFLSKLNFKTKTLSPDLLSDVLYSKRLDSSETFFGRMAVNNPFGVKGADGSLEEYSSLDAGVQAFISKIERMYDQLAEMSYRQQLDFLRDRQYISSSEHFNSTQRESDRLVRSIDNLNMSVKESNRLASMSQRTPNITAIPGRRYT